MYVPRMKEKYDGEVVPRLTEDFSYGNKMETPRFIKITLNMGLGEAIQNAKLLESSVKELALVTGQKPIVTRARRSIAAFKLREGMPIGCAVTLRRHKMWEFFDRLVNVAIPRIRDFRGISPKGFDGRGNFTMGIKEQIIFPEVDYDKIEKIKGMNISIVTSARTDEEALTLLKYMGMPFRK